VGAARLHVPAGNLSDRLRDGRGYPISTLTLGSLSAKHHVLAGDVLKFDIEGAEFGAFRVADFSRVKVLARSASGPIRLVLYPEQSPLAAVAALARNRRAIRAHTLAAFAVRVLLAVATWFALPWRLPLIYSEQFAEAVLPARIMLIVAVVQRYRSWFKTLPAALGKPQLRTSITVLELGLMSALLVLLGSRGSEGAAIALSVTSVVWFPAAIVGIHVTLRRAEAAHRPLAPRRDSVEVSAWG
jgi:hypothetical protein